MFRSVVSGLLFAGLALAACGNASDSNSAIENSVLVGTVTKVTDGDTIKVELSSGSITVRFGSIDSPERDQPWGSEATEALAGRIDGEEVALDVVTHDRYERLVAVVYLGDENINAWMVQQGHAWAYRQYLDDTNFCTWEESARRARRGLWSQSHGEWKAPWEWEGHEARTIVRIHGLHARDSRKLHCR